PLFHTVISRAHVENAIYGNAKDLIDYTNEQLKQMQSRYDELQIRFMELEMELTEERDKCRALQSRLEEALNENDKIKGLVIIGCNIRCWRSCSQCYMGIFI